MAQGSHATLGGWEPKTCAVCGNPVRVTRDSCWFHWDARVGRGWSFHAVCAAGVGWQVPADPEPVPGQLDILGALTESPA